ncbi:O-methyltransferase [Colletotrichum zoysiae]|uniref:O-methyltransferase n=1 Tax=Colletotrichum zoysiae TaxID=1216348 RepID=A0AAD9HAR2_9PEZI|nr:O-methyltransferase [Colletotrichum zoysiae]
MRQLTNQHRAELRQLATTLLTKTTQYTLRGELSPLEDDEAKSQIVDTAQSIADMLDDGSRERALDDCAKIGEMAAKQLFNSWGVFQQIPVQGSILYTDLARRVGCDLQLLVRLAWMLNSTGILKQIGDDSVAHTKNSKIFLNDNPDGDLTQIMFTHGLVSYAQLGEYFDSYGLREPQGPTHVPFTFAYGQPAKTIWDVSHQNPTRKRTFMRSMTAMGSVAPVCGLYDFSWIAGALKCEDTERVLLVDIGGGNGHALRSICASGVPLNRCVLQDLNAVISEVAKAQDMACLNPRLNLMAIDMHKEQPVTGALVYYIRYCLHDYGDDAAVNIIKIIAGAMSPDSKLLIAEQVMSNPPSAHAAALDLLMLNVGGKDRTRDAWTKVVFEAGLEIVKIWSSVRDPHAVIECVKTSEIGVA